MSQQIPASEAEDLLSKLLTERVPVRLFFITASGARLFMSGFVDSKTVKHGIGISVTSPLVDPMEGWFNFRPFGSCEFWYGEKRELPEDVLKNLDGPDNESALTVRFLDFGEELFLFFII